MRQILISMAVALSAFAYDLDPLFLVDGHIDVRTGDWIEKQGQAIYRSSKGKWLLCPHTQLILLGPDYTVCKGYEKTGLPLTYRLDSNHLYRIELPPSTTNTALGEPTAHTFLGNQTVSRLDALTLLIETPDHTRRIYKKTSHQGTDLHFSLQEEHLPDGSLITYSYDRQGQLYSVDGQPQSLPTHLPYPEGQVLEHEGSTFTYHPDKTVVSRPDGSETFYIFDHQKRLCAIHSFNANRELIEAIPFVFADNGQLLEMAGRSYAYDERGNVIEQWEKNLHLRRDFDAQDRIVQLAEEHGEQHLVTTYTYGDMGQLSRTVLDDGSHIRTIDIEGGADFPTEIRESAGDTLLKITRYSYYEGGAEESICDPDGTPCFTRAVSLSAIHRPWEMRYLIGTSKEGNTETDRDYFGRIVERRIVDESGAIHRKELWTYNAHFLLSYTDSHGLTTTYTYNDQGQKTQETLHTSKGALTTTYTYDIQGKISTKTLGPVVTHFDYDQTGTLSEVRETTRDGTLLTVNAPQPFSPSLSIDLPKSLEGVIVERDLSGNITHLKTDDGTVDYTITYNTRNQPIKVIDHIHNLTGQRTYDELGNLIEETLLSGLTLSSARDPYGRRLKLILPDKSTILYRWGAKFLTEIERISDRRKFTYLHHLVTYNTRGFPIRQRQLDGFGEITFETDGDSITAVHSRFINQTLDQLTPCSATARTIPYSYKTDGLGRITEIFQTDRTLIFTYDPWNRRMTKVVLEKQQSSRYDPVHLAFVYDDTRDIGAFSLYSNKLTELRVVSETPINTGGQAIAYELGGLLYLPQYDLGGNLASLISHSRDKLMESYRFSPTGVCEIHDAYGQVLHKSKALNPYHFREYRHDSETGLLYVEGAYYDPALETFLMNKERPL